VTVACLSVSEEPRRGLFGQKLDQGDARDVKPVANRPEHQMSLVELTNVEPSRVQLVMIRRPGMANIAQRNIAESPSASTAATLLRNGSIPSKAYGPTAAPRISHSGFDIRRPGSKDRLRKSSFATKAVSLDSLAALSVFMGAAEACSFTDAGRQLGLSSSAVGKCVARLEQRLNVRLFNRNTRCINLTHEGKTFLESCRRVFSELRSIEDELAQTKGAPKGKLRVSMPLTGMLMVPTLGNFIRDYPDIDLDIEFTDSFVDVVDGGYDLVLRSGEVNDSRLKSRRLGTFQYAIVGSPEYLAAAGVPLKPEDLLKHACLHRKHPTTGKPHPWPFAPSAIVNDLALPATAIASTLDALVHLAQSGVGIACVPNFCARRQIEEGSLVNILEEHIDRVEVVRAMWPASRYQSPKLRAFIDYLAGNLLPKPAPASMVKMDAA
jgi:DNA-binding transcriptional LysR family regulator